MGLPFGGQVQRRVGGVQVRPLRGAVGQPVDLHGPEHGQQLTGVTRLDPAAPDAVGTSHVKPRFGLLGLGPQRQVVLEQLPDQPTSLGVELVLQSAVAQASCGRPVQEPHQRLEQLTAIGERVHDIAGAVTDVDADVAGVVGRGCAGHRFSRSISVARPASPSASILASAAR